MSRDTTAAVDAALAADNVRWICFVKLEFDSGTHYYTNAPYNFTWDGQTWTGLGRLGSINPIHETDSLEANGLQLILSVVDSTIAALALSEHYQGRPGSVWLAPLSEGYGVLADPVLLFRGRMDAMPISLGKQANIGLTIESRLADWDRPRVRRYNNADQQAEYAGDRGFEFVEALVEKQILWGVGTMPAAAAAAATTPGTQIISSGNATGSRTETVSTTPMQSGNGRNSSQGWAPLPRTGGQQRN